jgi:hypothetical protein
LSLESTSRRELIGHGEAARGYNGGMETAMQAESDQEDILVLTLDGLDQMDGVIDDDPLDMAPGDELEEDVDPPIVDMGPLDDSEVIEVMT